MDNVDEMSKEMLRYFKNKERYNERAKKYFNEIYYPKHKTKILQKLREGRTRHHPPKENKTNTSKKTINKVVNHSLIVSFD